MRMGRRAVSLVAMLLMYTVVTPWVLPWSSLAALEEGGRENGSRENEGDDTLRAAARERQRMEEQTVPLPYEREEFPSWAWDLRRGEIIAFGAFPLAMIVSGIGLQLGRFAYHSVREGGFSQEYAPFFLSTRVGPRYNEDERIGLLISAGIISTGVAIADYILGRREERARSSTGTGGER